MKNLIKTGKKAINITVLSLILFSQASFAFDRDRYDPIESRLRDELLEQDARRNRDANWELYRRAVDNKNDIERTMQRIPMPVSEIKTPAQSETAATQGNTPPTQ